MTPIVIRLHFILTLKITFTGVGDFGEVWFFCGLFVSFFMFMHIRKKGRLIDSGGGLACVGLVGKVMDSCTANLEGIRSGSRTGRVQLRDVVKDRPYMSDPLGYAYGGWTWQPVLTS